MKDWLPTLLSELHTEYLKPLGFKKARRTFSRNRGEYHERFNFQGSSWSSAEEKCFYLNVGIEFNDLAPEPYWSYFANTHWAERIEDLVASAPTHWDCDASTDREELKGQLHQLILKASQVLAERAREYRSQYLAQMRKRAEPAA